LGSSESLAPVLDKAMHIALEDLQLENLYVVYPGKECYPLCKRVEALPLTKLSVIRFDY
jgi:hypothetical protein